MTEHQHTHGLDLDAIRERMGSHSIFGPSSSPMWLHCSGSLIPHLMAPDNANEDAAYGTVGHEVAEIWLKRLSEAKSAATFRSLIDYYAPTELIGTTKIVNEGSGRSFEVEIDEDMLVYVREYIDWCVEDLGTWDAQRGWEADIYIEQRVDLSRLMPLENQGGTADFAACRWQHLTITDLKMGKGVRVFAQDNDQARLYALGFFYEWDWLYNFQTIVIRIAQPRLDHWDVWEITREELLDFADFVKERAALAWVPNAPRTPGPKQCQWCRVSDCPAAAMFADQAVNDAFDNLDAPGELIVSADGTIEGVEYTVTEQAAWAEQIVKGKRDPYADMKQAAGLSTEALAKLLPYRKLIEKWFEGVAQELQNRALAGEEIPGFKLADGRASPRKWADERKAVALLRRHNVDDFDYMESKLASPAKAEELLHRAGLKKKEAKELIDAASIRTPGRSTLVPVKDDRPALAPPGEVFDNLDEL